MSVHYKFIKAALEYSTVTFDGIHITVADLKKEIIEQKHLKQNADFDLQIMNAQTEEVYEDENALIPKNTSVIVARLPVSNKRNSSNAPGGAHRDHRQQHHARNPPTLQPSAVAKGVDLASMDATEEEKIKAMMSQSTADYDPSRYQRLRGGGQHGRVPPSYRCNKCGNGSHWIKDCPLQTEHTDIKKSTGIPRSFMVHVDGPDVPGALMTPEGRFAVPAVDHAAYMEQKKPAVKPPPSKPKIPDELVCTLCDDLMTDALMVPCCANSYCDDCIRKALLDSDEQECPGCHEKEISPTSLIPNRFLRSTVNTFKNDTGYSKPQPAVEKESSVIMVDLTEKKSEESERRKLSLDELPDDLFPHSPRKIDPEAEAKEKEAEGNEDEEKTDLYDFNDGSIPSPFATPPPAVEPQESEQAIRTIGTTNHFYGGQLPGHMGRHHQQSSHIPTHHQGMGHHGRPQKVDGYRPPRTPLQSGMPPLPHTHHGHHPPPVRRPPGGGPGPLPGQGSGPLPGQGPPESHEPPPPGFGDMLPLPPGEDRAPTPTGRGREENIHRRDERREMGDRGPDQDGPPRGSLLPLPGIPPFNPSQPPPGFSGPQGGPQSQSQKGPVGLPPPGPIYPGPPQGSGPPPPMGMVPPNQNYPPPPYHGNYGMPPGGGGNRPPPYHSGMRGPHPRDRDRERYSMREKTMRKPLPRDARPRERDRPDEIKPGVIEDPLKEFERLMREKDRRKKLQQDRKRSRSRSYSPGGRRTPPSPFPKRSRSRSYSRSPSPKRKRSAPLRRRESYSRTPSRSPPPPRRRLRSRSRSRNRSLTPPNALSKRRSPRRAPPFSPSPPPSRFPLPRKEKEDFYDRATRYEGGGSGSSRYYNSSASGSGPNNGKPYSSTSGRDYPEPVAKYDVKYGDAPPPKYDQGSHPAGAPSSGGGGGGAGGGGKYEKFEPRRSREREMYLHHSSSSSAGPPPPSSYRDSRDRDRDRGRDLRERESGDHNRDREAHRPVPYEFDPVLMPPGTETHMQTNSNLTAVPPSLFELEIPPPSGFSQNNAKGGAPLPPSSVSPQSYHSSHHYHHHHPSHPSSRHAQAGAPPPQAQKDHHRKSREKDSVTDLGSLSVSPESEPDDDSHKDRDGRKRHHRKKSREGSSEKGDKKKERKEKKKHKKKKEKEEKKLKKNKKTKSSDKMSKDGSEDEHTTTTADETGPSRRNSATETTNSNIKEEAERIPADGDKLGMEMIRELERRTHEIDSKNSNLTVIVCDSTVKSPDRSSQVIQPFRNLLETEYGDKVDDDGGSLAVKKAIDSREVDAGAIRRDTDQYGPQDTVVANLGVPDVAAQDLYQGREFSDKNESRLTETSLTDKDESLLSESTKLEEIPVVSSKWDQFGEDEDPESLLHPEGSTPKDSSRLTEDGEQISNVKSTAVEKKVTSEVLKRAENAIFQKAISAISGSSRSSSASRRGSPPHSSSSKRKVYIESFDVPPSEKDAKSKNDGDGSKMGTGSSATKPSVDVESKSSSAAAGTAVKRSVRDRLGSKVTEDAADASTSSSSRTRDRSSPSRDRDKDRQIKSQVGNAPSRDRDRDRKKPSRSRSRSPRGRRDRHSRSRSPRGGRDRDRDRPRPTARRSRSRSRRRSVSRSRRDTRRATPRSTSQLNRNVNRQRTPLKLGRRSRSISSSRTKRPRSKSGSRGRDSRQNRDREPRRLSREPKDREPSPPGEGSSSRSRTSPSRTKKNNKTENEEAWTQQANKFVPIGSSGGAGGMPEGTSAKSEESEKSGDVEWQQSGSNPVPLAVRKQKGRINIKLSSTTTSKSEPGKSSSSSSDDEDHQGKGDGKDRSSGDSDDSSRREERKRKKERKKAKRRRSESSSSSSSDDSAPRKSKKSKKKKKKSKKKKKVK